MQLIEREIAPGIYEFSGRAETEYINDTYHLDIPEGDEYQTLAGYILYTTGQIPEKGAVLELDGFRMEIIDKSDNRLELIRVSRMPDAEA